MPETEEERRIRKEKERESRPKETEEERRIRKEKEKERGKETEEERRIRKEKEKERSKETEEERRIRKEKEREREKDRPKETEEERRIRKEKEREREKERGERPKETEEERRIRKEKEREREKERGERPKETEEERRIRKEKEREREKERPKETEEERRIRKEKEREREKERSSERHKETEEERRIRKEKERDGEGPKETEEERRIRKEKERERSERPKETEEERRIRKEKEREREKEKERPKETEEERRIRKEKERGERDKKEERPRETEEERRIRKEKERERGKETEEERRIRKEKERSQERDKSKETEEERRIRKEKERAEKDGSERPKETEEERAARKEKERAERDKGKETEEERKIRKEKEAKEKEEKKRKEEEKKKKEDEKKKEDDADEDDYGDDFEDYGDDFDDFEEEEEERPFTPSSSDSEGLYKPDKAALEMRKAMEKENKKLADKEKAEKKKKEKKSKRTEDKKDSKPSRHRMNPNESKNQAKATKKFLKKLERAEQISRLVDLDFVTYDVADIPPQTEYELYIGTFGSNTAAQASTQIPDTNEIDEAEVQTEKINYRNRDIQVPEDLGLFAQPTGLITQDKPKSKANEEVKFMHIDTIGLGKFMSKAYPVFRVMLMENEGHNTSGTKKSDSKFSDTYVGLGAQLFSGRSVNSIAFSEINQQLLLTVYSPTKILNPVGVNPDEDISHLNGAAAVWNVNNPKMPQTILVSNSALTAGCWSAKKGYLVFAGTKDGAVCVWDQREPDYMHTNSIRSVVKKTKKSDQNIARYPTYSTEWMWKENHQAPIVRILPVGYNSWNQLEISEQIATLDQDGVVMFWVVVEVGGKAHDISDTDFGLSPFGKIKIIKSSQTHCNNPQKYLNPEVIKTLDAKKDDEEFAPRRGKPKSEEGLIPQVAAYDLEFQPDDPSQLLVGTDAGYVLHCSRFQHFGGPSPNTYRSVAPNLYLEARDRAKSLSLPRDLKFGTRALSIHYCPYDCFFLVGFHDGTASLYKTEDQVPLFTLSGFTTYPIICVRWNLCKSRQGVFFVLDAAGCLFVFDLFRERADQRLEPINSSELAVQTTGEDGKTKITLPITMEMCPDMRSDPKMAISYDDGHVDLHTIKSELVRRVKEDRNDVVFLGLF